MELTFSLSWNEKVVEVCDYLPCVQVGLLQNRPGRYMENIWKMLQKRPRRCEKLLGNEDTSVMEFYSF